MSAIELQNTKPFQQMAVVGLAIATRAIEDINTFEQVLFTGQIPGNAASIKIDPAKIADVITTALRDAHLENQSGIPLFLSVDEISQPDWTVLQAALSMPVIRFTGISAPLQNLIASASSALSGGSPAVVIAACQLSVLPDQAGACAALVLTPKDHPQGKTVYAFIDGQAASAQATLEDAIADACHQAMQLTGHLPGEIGALEASSPAGSLPDSPEMTALAKAYCSDHTSLTCALGSTSAYLGNTGGATSLIGMLRLCLSLSERILPMLPGWNGVPDPDVWMQSPFYVPASSRVWFNPDDRGFPRLAALNQIGPGPACTHVILSAAPEKTRSTSEPVHTLGVYLLPLAGLDSTSLLDQTLALKARILNGDSLQALSKEVIQKYMNSVDAPYAMAILGHTPQELLREIEFAQKGIVKAFETGADWQTPMGSFLTVHPLGKDTQISFVYPGAFNSYLGIGKDLFFAFPGLYQRFSELTSNIGQVLREDKLYPRSLNALSPTQIEMLEAEFNHDPIVMLTSGAALAVLYTLVLQEWFGVEPGSAFGYSLGETSMLFAAQVWTHGEHPSAILATSPLFKTRIAGPKETVRQYWGLTDRTEPEVGESIWENYILMAPAEQVYPAIQPGERVYLTHINTPRQVVIGGDPQTCQKVIQKVGASSLKAPFDHVLHCEVMAAEYPTLVDLNHWPIQNQVSIPLYSAADYQPLRLETQAVATSLGKMLCTPLDFPRLVHSAYDHGSRIFIELGAGSNCTRWIEDTLKGQPHAALSINRKGLTDPEAILRALSRLVSQRINLDLSRLVMN